MRSNEYSSSVCTMFIDYHPIPFRGRNHGRKVEGPGCGVGRSSLLTGYRPGDLHRSGTKFEEPVLALSTDSIDYRQYITHRPINSRRYLLLGVLHCIGR